MKKSLYLIAGLLLPSIVHPYVVTSEQKQVSPQKTDINLHVKLNPHELVYEKHILISTDNPNVKLSKWKTDKDAVSSYDPKFKENRKVFGENFSISTHAIKTTDVATDAQLHLTLASNQSPQPQDETFDIHFKDDHADIAPADSTAPQKKAAVEVKTTPAKQDATFFDSVKEYREQLKQTIAQSDSWLFRFILAYILGLLLSLTPCIYPMIPITVGILQAQGSKSIVRNFLLSFCYTLGMGTTFSIMGLIAASSGAAFGSLMVNPIFVLFIVSFLSYFAFSLFGFYRLYIPRFMQNKGSVSKSGSAMSIFVFGLASGSVASPCLSPGLALILTMVATMANKFLGFLLLFAFGFGISTPLLIIGTFSGSINLLPKAGTWMVEIQKVFGFMLLGMCFYYLSNILPWWMILVGLTGFLCIMGAYYLRSAVSSTGSTKQMQNIFGVIAIVGAVFLFVETFQELYYPQLNQAAESSWYKDYDKALADAKAQNKMLFIDFWTPYCSICKAITATVLKNTAVESVLNDKYIILSVDAADSSVEPYKTLRAKYDTWGAPNLLVVNPKTGKELKRWQSEMYDMDIDEVVKELKRYAH
jgi:thioredoxin:protein disulfide reductase